MSGGLINCPIVIRGPANGGTNVGATHSHTPENWFAAIPGLKVVCPATTAYDAKGLMKSAIRDNDPVMFMENTLLYGERSKYLRKNILSLSAVADLKREGSDVSLIAHGRSALIALKAAEILSSRTQHQADVLDLRSIRPLDRGSCAQRRCARRIAQSWSTKTSPSAESPRRFPLSSWRTPLTIWTLR